jgi:E3 SUMO-protein ligase PIAS1
VTADHKSASVMAQHRNTTTIHLSVSTHPPLQRCLGDSSIKVMVFCAASASGNQDIAFPYNCELKVNGGDVKANFRGLKGKPGSTQPADITHLLRLKPPAYRNSVDFTWALTNKVRSLPLTSVWPQQCTEPASGPVH